MAIHRQDLRKAAKGLAQDNGDPALLQKDPDDYNACIVSALQQLDRDRPRTWTRDCTVSTAGWRFTLYGTSQILPTSGLDAWIPGSSGIAEIYAPYSGAQGELPVDPNEYRIVEDPGPKTVLELLSFAASLNDVLRVRYTAPHQVHESDAEQTSVLLGDWPALEILTGAIICEQAAIRYAQNTGTSMLQGDTVDRRTQSDVMRSRAKNLRDRYAAIVGAGGVDANLQGASATKDLDVSPGTGLGFLFHSRGSR